jgi:hypothetical protein
MHTYDEFNYDRTGWNSGNGFSLYSGGSRFKSRPGHPLSWPRFFVVLYV